MSILKGDRARMEFTGVTFQRFDDQPAVLFAQVVFVRLLPIVVLGIPTVVACT